MWSDRDFANYIVGQADADSTFCISVYHAKKSRYGVGIRIVWQISKYHDKKLLEYMRDFLGVGRVDTVKQKGSDRVQYQLTVSNHKDLPMLVEFFERFPLRGKKRKDFELWKKAVEVIVDRKRDYRFRWTKQDLIAILDIVREMQKLDRKQRRPIDVANFVQLIQSI